MAFTNTKESGLESLIVKWLVEQNGYEEGTNADYNKEYAVDETRLFRFLQDTQPKEMDKLGEAECKRKGIHQLLAACVALGAECAGVRCAFTYSRGTYTDAAFGFPLCLNSEEKAEFVGKQFFELCCTCYGITPKMD